MPIVIRVTTKHAMTGCKLDETGDVRNGQLLSSECVMLKTLPVFCQSEDSYTIYVTPH